MHITRIITVVILFVFLFAISSVHPLLPMEPEKPAEESASGKIREEEWPEGFAFEQLEKIKTTGRDVLYYAVVRHCQIVGWTKVEYDLGVWKKRPAVRVKVTAEIRDPSYGRAHMEDTSYYDADLKIQSFTVTGRKEHGNTERNSVFRAVREDGKLKTEMKHDGKVVEKGEIRLEKLPEPPLRPFVLYLRYYERGVSQKDKIALMDDNWFSTSRQGVGKVVGQTLVATLVGDDLIECAIVQSPSHKFYVLEKSTGLLVRKATSGGSHMLISRETFDKWVKDFKWVEAEQEIARNIATLLPKPSKPVADWKTKKDKLAEYWHKKAGEIDAGVLKGIKELAPRLLQVNSNNPPEEIAAETRKYGTDLIAFLFSESLREQGDTLQYQIAAVKAIPILYKKDFPTQVRDSLIALLYYKTPGCQYEVLNLLSMRCWDQDLEDICLERLQKSSNPLLLPSICKIFPKKRPTGLKEFSLFVLTSGNIRSDDKVVSLMKEAISDPIFIGLLFERCSLDTPNFAGDVTLETLQKILGDDVTLGPNIFPFYYGWCKTVFDEKKPTDEIRKKAMPLIALIDSDRYEVRTVAREKLVKMGEDLLPLLKEQRNHDSPEVRAAVKEIADEIVAPGYWDTTTFINKKHYDRNLEMFIGFLACQTPRLRENALAKLKTLTGEDFGQDFAKWYAWYGKNKNSLKWDEGKQRYIIAE